MNKINNVINDYTSGEITLEQANAVLAELPGGLYLDPEKNVIKPGEENAYGLLDTGTGSLDKVRVKGGRLVHSIGKMPARCYYKGKCYDVKNDVLVPKD